MAFQVPEAARTALNLLEAAGHEAWFVGGWVRDKILGRPSFDMDIATSATPEETLDVFKNYRTIPTGIKHGTITLLLSKQSFEITTYRTEGSYSDSRHPDSVSFVRSIQEDLARRDFTCNAMAWHPQRGLMDPFLGQQACETGVLACVGEPKERFREDALRILRGFRFACQLGFDIAPDTLSAMMEESAGLDAISIERVTQEMNKALLGKHAPKALLAYPQVLFLALPELKPMLHTPQRTVFHRYDVWTHSVKTLGACPRELALRWAALLHDSGKPHAIQHEQDGTTRFPGHQAISTRLAKDLMARLKQPKSLTEMITTLVAYHDERMGPDNLKLFLSKLGYEATLLLIKLQYADLYTHSDKVKYRLPQLDALYLQALELQQNGACLHVKDLAVNGQDLMALGYPQGKQLGEALNRLLDLVLQDKTENKKSSLTDLAASWLNKDN